MSAVGGTAEVVARLVAIIEGWLDSLVASPKILRTQMMIVNEGPLLARSGRSLPKGDRVIHVPRGQHVRTDFLYYSDYYVMALTICRRICILVVSENGRGSK